MEYITICIIVVIVAVVFAVLMLRRPKKAAPKKRRRYDIRGFDDNHIHKNGTKYDDYGYDYKGYDANGYDVQGYNIYGKNAEGQYNRFYDTQSCDKDGFSSPGLHPIAVTDHACERFEERLAIHDYKRMEALAKEAYKYGKSKRQLKKSSALMLEDIEQRHENGIALIYRNYIYIFSSDNVLITLYKNEKIPL